MRERGEGPERTARRPAVRAARPAAAEGRQPRAQAAAGQGRLRGLQAEAVEAEAERGEEAAHAAQARKATSFWLCLEGEPGEGLQPADEAGLRALPRAGEAGRGDRTAAEGAAGRGLPALRRPRRVRGARQRRQLPPLRGGRGVLIILSGAQGPEQLYDYFELVRNAPVDGAKTMRVEDFVFQKYFDGSEQDGADGRRSQSSESEGWPMCRRLQRLQPREQRRQRLPGGGAVRRLHAGAGGGS